MKKNLIVVGAGGFAEIAHDYFMHDGNYQVVAFAVEQAFLDRTELFGLPVVPFEGLQERYAPQDHEVYVAIVYNQLNRLRTRLSGQAKLMGYRLASYVSPRAFVWPNVQLGEHCFVFENNVLQPFVSVGNNVVLWSGNHVGHHSKIQDNVFVSSHVVISGFCEIGANSFLGVNATIGNNIVIGKDCWIGPGVTIWKNTADGALYPASESEPSKVGARRFFKVKD
jgi:sugar O-acyltransferase (sialic acid O-acetyltransferase NeuD family)